MRKIARQGGQAVLPTISGNCGVLVDPDIRMLEVYRLSEGHWLLEGTWKDDDEVRAAPVCRSRFAIG